MLFARPILIMLRYFVFFCVLSLGCSGFVVSTSTSDRLERLVSEMTKTMLNRAYSLHTAPSPCSVLATV